MFDIQDAGSSLLIRLTEQYDKDPKSVAISFDQHLDKSGNSLGWLRHLRHQAVHTRDPEQIVVLGLDMEEAAVVKLLCQEHDLSVTSLFRQMLRSYQHDHERRKDGETVTWSGDAQRAREFAGDLLWNHTELSVNLHDEIKRILDDYFHGDAQYDHTLVDRLREALAQRPTGSYHVVNHHIRKPGKRSAWAEVRRSVPAPGIGGHVAHCPELADALMITDVLNRQVESSGEANSGRSANDIRVDPDELSAFLTRMEREGVVSKDELAKRVSGFVASYFKNEQFIRDVTTDLSQQNADGQSDGSESLESFFSQVRPVVSLYELAAWLTSVASGTWTWMCNSQCKYVSLHIDTRTGAYRLTDRDGHPLTKESLLHQLESEKRPQATSNELFTSVTNGAVFSPFESTIVTPDGHMLYKIGKDGLVKFAVVDEDTVLHYRKKS